MAVSPVGSSSQAEMKRAWGTEMSAGVPETVSQSAAAGTLASMQRPLKLTSLHGSSIAPGNNIAMNNETKNGPQESSSMDCSSEESESADETGRVTVALQSPSGVAPPPPLRNIPHQTPGTSTPARPLSFFSQQNKPIQLSIPKTHRHSLPKMGDPISVQPREKKKSLPTNYYPVMMIRPLKGISTLATQQQMPERSETSNSGDSPSPPKITLPHPLEVGPESVNSLGILSAPISTSTPTKPEPSSDRVISAPVSAFPKAKRALFPDISENVKQERVQKATHSEPELRRNIVMRDETIGVAAGEATTAAKSNAKRKPLRAPSRLLQKFMSHDLSSSSDVSAESDESETRDKFDTEARLPVRSLPMLARGGLTPLPGRTLLSPLSAGAKPLSLAPLNLPPIVRPPPAVPHRNSLPSYQEAGTSHQEADVTNVTPPNYYSSNFVPAPDSGGGTGGGVTGGIGRLQSQDISNHPIHLAAMEGVSNSQMKTLALQSGVDYRDIGGRTPLMYSVLGNQPKICELLIKMKADVNARDLAGQTALLWATYLAKAEIIRVLLKNGADPRFSDQDGRTVFHWAMKTPNIHCLKWLCKHANIPEIINQPDNDMLTALHWAVMGDQAAHVKMFLTMTKADISVQDSEGRSPLNYAVLTFSPTCIKAILDYNEASVSLIDSKGRTALHYACAEGSADCVRTLLSYKKCDIHFTDNSGTTPLHWAAVANQPGLVQLLLRRGADRGQQDGSGYTALDYAKQRGHTDCISILQSYGLRRPGSAGSLASLASHVAVNINPQPSNLDADGHVVFRQLQRHFSLTGSAAATSYDRPPADGKAWPENLDEGTEPEGQTFSEEGSEPSERGERVEGAEPNLSTEHTDQGHEEDHKDTGRELEPEPAEPEMEQLGPRSDLESRPKSGNRRMSLKGAGRSDHDVQIIITRTATEAAESVQSTGQSWRSLLCCGCGVKKRTNVVVPM